jgi:hypothetical protein
MEAGKLVVVLFLGHLWSPKALTLETLVLCLESSHDRVPGHGVKVFVYFVMDLDGLELEG